MQSVLIGFFALALTTGSTSLSQTRPAGQERLPHLGFSIAQPAQDGVVRGSLFRRFQEALAAANAGGGTGFAAFLTPDAELKLVVARNPDAVTVPFSGETIRAITASCLGPYSHNEGRNWAQLSWVCRTDGVGPLASLLTFEYTSELSVTVWFEGQRIKEIEASEPLWIPMRRRPAMDAFEHIQRDER